ncbi:hypothetical protein nbrc107696_39290 [Gordonia spumicola]|uniref:Protease n=1 Tax=Gordonia spumicola TaxID=589161 RepID=A0A7I9VEE2_9ACTN|nr:peptidase S1 [Gordonia spumicola]GEE03483.1 hypothetical protein nbrc107696_39290 [Gordonia spumicola]
MNILKKALVGAAAVLAATSMVPAATADAAPRVTLGGGSGIIVGGNALCTLTTIGHDRAGRLVGLTAAHCGNNGASIRSERNPRAGVVGRIATKGTGLDAAVIVFDASRVHAVRQVGRARISGVGVYPRPYSNVCKAGRTTGYTCGPTLTNGKLDTYNYVCADHGDSGGPVIAGGRVVGMLNGALRIAGPGSPSIPCVTPAVPIYTPMVATKMTTILASLNRTRYAGSGFRPI